MSFLHIYKIGKVSIREYDKSIIPSMSNANLERHGEFFRMEEEKLYKAQNGLWRKWGPYLIERQWGTVREDYSPHGNAWEYLPHDHARSRAHHALRRFAENAPACLGCLRHIDGRIRLATLIEKPFSASQTSPSIVGAQLRLPLSSSWTAQP